MKRSNKTVGMLIAGLVVSATVIALVVKPADKGLNEPESVIALDDQAVLERAYEDVRNSEEFPGLEDEVIIKIFDDNNELIDSITLLEGDEVTDENFIKLINQSTLLAEYRTSKVYKMNK